MSKSLARREVSAAAMALGGYALLSSSVSFLGWPLDVPRLTDWFGDNVSIQPNACVLIALSGAAVMLVQARAWRAVSALGGFVGAGGLLILLQYVIDVDLGFNHQLLFGRTWGQATTLTAGRVGPPASSSFALIGCALFLLGAAGDHPARAPWRRFVPAIGITICGIMLFSLFGYMFAAKQFYTIPWLTAIALPTATMLLAVGIGLILCVSERDPMRLLLEQSGAGALARNAIPALAILVPLVLWLRVKGFEAGYYDLGTGRALGALALVAATIAVFWIALLALRRHEDALRAQDRRKDEFLAILAHELRNPLAPLTNALALLDLPGRDDASAAEARAAMSRQVKHLVRLVDDLLDVSRISRGTVEVHKERIELQSILREVVEAMQPVCQAAGQQLHVRLPSRPVWIHVDRVRFVQIVSNLLSNASRHSEAGTPIDLSAAREGADIVLSVKDRGIGIPPDKLDAIFEIFTRLDNSLERVSGGLGIGLYLVRQLARMHGGTVSARSEGPGKGSEFILRLPVVVDAPVDAGRGAPAAEGAAPPVRRRSVLVVDDNADAAVSMATLLRAHGHEAHVAHDGVQAVEAAERLRPDVILLDIGMPGLNGYEACRRIREREWGAKPLIVALTGWGQQRDRARATESGFDSHFAKPVEWQALARLLDRPAN